MPDVRPLQFGDDGRFFLSRNSSRPCENSLAAMKATIEPRSSAFSPGFGPNAAGGCRFPPRLTREYSRRILSQAAHCPERAALPQQSSLDLARRLRRQRGARGDQRPRSACAPVRTVHLEPVGCERAVRDPCGIDPAQHAAASARGAHAEIAAADAANHGGYHRQHLPHDQQPRHRRGRKRPRAHHRRSDREIRARNSKLRRRSHDGEHAAPGARRCDCLPTPTSCCRPRLVDTLPFSGSTTRHASTLLVRGLLGTSSRFPSEW